MLTFFPTEYLSVAIKLECQWKHFALWYVLANKLF